VVRQALQFQNDATQHVGSEGNTAACECFHHLAIGRRVADRRVSRDCLQSVEGSLVWSADERAFGASMLITEGNLQMKDQFTVTLKPKMSRLNDTGVNGTDRDLVDFVSKRWTCGQSGVIEGN